MSKEEIEGFFSKLGITHVGDIQGGKYVIKLDDSNEYSRAYTALDKSELTDLDTEKVSMGLEGSTMVYLSDDYDITLKADFEANEYTIEAEEAKD